MSITRPKPRSQINLELHTSPSREKASSSIPGYGGENFLALVLPVFD